MESLPVIVKIRMQHIRFFRKSAAADLKGGGKEWAGNVYIGGTHPAAAGGAYMTAIKGFAGITMEDGQIKAHPHLPDGWEKMRFPSFIRESGMRYVLQQMERR